MLLSCNFLGLCKRKDTGISRSSITNACLGKTSTAYGMHWLYYEDYINKTTEDIKEILLKVPDDPLSVVCLETREVYSSIVKDIKKISFFLFM